MKRLTLSRDCREQFAAWLTEHCPCAFDDPRREFYRGILVICQEEVNRQLHGYAERAQRPSPQ
jgi:hypothetical protein